MDKKDRPLLLGTLFQPSSDPKEMLLWIKKLEAILTIIIALFDRTIILTSDTNIDTKKNTVNLDFYQHVE